jgi:type II secretory pathway pseudopilin PulG
MKKSFSLIEVLVFTAVLGLFFVAAVSVTTFNLKNMKIQEHKILATRYAEEAVEWMKQKKEDDWSVFAGHNAGYYCLNSLDNLDWTSYSNSSPVCTAGDYISGTIFKRELLMAKPADQVNTTVTVTWQDMGTDLSVKIKTVFKLLE